MGREIELKLELEPEALTRVRQFRGLKPHLGAQTLGRAKARTLRSTYFDTEDIDLRREGVALRVREAGRRRIQTVKSRKVEPGPLNDRSEFEADLMADAAAPDLNRIPADLRQRIETAAGSKSLSPLFVTDIRRTERVVRLADGGEIDLAFDEGRIQANGKDTPVSEIELELKKGQPASLYRLALDLAKLAPLRVNQISKAERGYALAAKATPPNAVKSKPVRLSKTATFDDVCAISLRHALAHMMANEPALIQAREPEALHQMRVALRRLRAGLSMFGRSFGCPATGSLVDEARWLGGELGAARDFDVFCTQILTPVEAARSADPGLVALRSFSEAARTRAWNRARQAVAGPRYAEFVLRLALYIEERGWHENASAGERARMPLEAKARTIAPSLLDRYLKKASKLGRRIDSLSSEQRHELRKRLKTLRYASGYFASLYNKKATARYLGYLSRLQDVFGELNDVATADHLVHDLSEALDEDGADKALRPELARAGGLVLGWHSARAEADWTGARDLWRRFEKAEPFWRE